MDRPTPEQARQALTVVDRQRRDTGAAMHPWRFTVVSAVAVAGYFTAGDLPGPYAGAVRVVVWVVLGLLVVGSWVPAVAAVTGRPALPRRRTPRRPWVWVAAGLVAAVTGGVVGYLSAGTPPQWTVPGWVTGVALGLLMVLLHPLAQRLGARDDR